MAVLGSGLADIIAAEKAGSQHVEKSLLKLNHEVQLLTSPAEMGELFKVMALAKQFDHELSGFSIRDMRGRL